MKVLEGISAKTGLTEGVAFVYSEEIEENIPHYTIDGERVEKEISRLKEAYGRARKAIDEMLNASGEIFGKTGEDVFSVHSGILKDDGLFEKIVDSIRERLINAEHAVIDVFGDYRENLEQKNHHFAEFSQDVIDVRNRILSSFENISEHPECPEGERGPAVIVAKRLNPSIVLNTSKKDVLAFVTEEGGLTSHATILAENFNVPIVFGVEAMENINCGDKVIVDGSMGKVLIQPDESTEQYYKEKIKKMSKRQKYCRVKEDVPSKTKEGVRLTLKANISLPTEMKFLEDLNYDGIGLLRSEFLFTKRYEAPSEEDWFRIYKRIMKNTAGKTVDIRLLDVGTDKLPQYLYLPPQENPDLGVRGARALEIFYGVYLAQMKAILRISLDNDVRLLYPMVSDVSDIESFRKVKEDAESILRKEDKEYDKNIKEGIMIETPAAAIMTQTLLEYVEFANIGTNDLLQYTLAASRTNQIIEKKYHILHPSLVRLMEVVIEAALKHGKEVCLCGEIAGFEEFYPLFLSLGMDSFSVEASKLNDIKCHLLHLEKPDESYLDAFYKNSTGKEIENFFRNREITSQKTSGKKSS